MTAALFDCIVVGSGPSGVMCAQTLVEAGKKVLLIDAGVHAEVENPGWASNFLDIRRNSHEQEELFLGNELEVLHHDSDKEFGQMTPLRSYIVKDAKEILPVTSDTFAPLESLASGGLGNAWGLGCYTFSDAELLKAKLNPLLIKKAYQVISDRIGISYTPDDIRNYTAADLKSMQPGIKVDSNAKDILKRYDSKKKTFNEQSLFAGVPALALLTVQKDNRKATDYSNMDFYYNFGSAAYRPSVTLEILNSHPDFFHQRGVVVNRFEETDNIVLVSGIDMTSQQSVQFKASKLVLACNVIGTARIVLRSFNMFRKNIPLLCNPHSLMATIQWSRLGKLPSIHKTSTVQVSLFLDEELRHSYVPMASLYSYSSLMLFRLLKKSPLNFRDSLYIMNYLQSAIVIAGIHHPSEFSDSKYLSLEQGETLKIGYSETAEEKHKIRRTEKRFARVLRQLGCIPFQKTSPPPGSSAHYAGTLPFADDSAPLSLSPEGQIWGTQNVFVADASGFHYLPAKGPTLTIMANAHNIALNIIRDDE